MKDIKALAFSDFDPTKPSTLWVSPQYNKDMQDQLSQLCPLIKVKEAATVGALPFIVNDYRPLGEPSIHVRDMYGRTFSYMDQCEIIGVID
jgi:hypothetical protein